MKHKIIEKLDFKYAKICTYAVVSFLIALIAALLIINSAPAIWNLFSLFSSIMKPLLYGMVIAYLLSPVVKRIERFLPFKDNLKHLIAVVLTFLLLFGILLGIALLIYTMLFRSFSGFSIDTIREAVIGLQEGFADWSENIQGLLNRMQIGLGSISGYLSDFVSALLSGIQNTASILMLSLIYSIYFLLDGNNIYRYWSRVFHILVRNPAHKDTLHLLAKDANFCFSGYIRGVFVDSIFVAVTISIVMTIVGVPYAPIVGMMMGIGNLIPYMGAIVGYITVALTCLQAESFEKLIIGIVCVAVVAFIDGEIVNPRLLSQNVETHPLLVVVALMVGASIGGFIGMLVAVPSAAFLKMQFERLLKRLEQHKQETNDNE